MPGPLVGGVGKRCRIATRSIISSMVDTTMAPASSTWVRIVAKSPISAPVCDCAALRALAPRPACIITIGLPANLLAVERDHAGGAVVGEEFDEISAFETGFVAGRDHVSERKAEAVGG